jgi:O-antigen/teichoic acid export membrane protein
MGKELLSFGAWMTLSNMIGPIMVVADRFIISFALGAAWVAYYTVPADLLFYVLFIPSALSVALFPKFAFMSQNDVVAMRSMYMRSVKVVAAVMLVFSVFVMCFAYPGLVWWLGKSFAEKSYQIVMILALGLFFNGIAQIPFAIVQASGGVKKIAKMHCVECVFYVPVLFILLKSWGVLGAAVAWSIRVTCDFVVLLIYANQALHETKIRLNSREN